MERKGALLVLAAAVLLTGCVAKSDFVAKSAELDATKKDLASLEEKQKSTEKSLADEKKKNEELTAKAADLEKQRTELEKTKAGLEKEKAALLAENANIKSALEMNTDIYDGITYTQLRSGSEASSVLLREMLETTRIITDCTTVVNLMEQMVDVGAAASSQPGLGPNDEAHELPVMAPSTEAISPMDPDNVLAASGSQQAPPIVKAALLTPRAGPEPFELVTGELSSDGPADTAGVISLEPSAPQEAEHWVCPVEREPSILTAPSTVSH